MKGALKMKHKTLVLGVMLSCLLGLTACGAEVKSNTVEGSRYSSDIFTQESLKGFAESLEDNNFEGWYLQGITPDNFESNLYFDIALNSTDERYEVLASGYDSWYKALDDLGYNSVETLANDIFVKEVNYEVNKDDELVVNAVLQGTKHTADMEIYLTNRGEVTDIGVTVNKTTAEKLENAGLNTLLGMGMAFTILILISLIISLFPMLFGGNKKKKESDKEITQKAMDNTINQIAEQEDLSSDAELVAVIAAAIAAYEGSAGTDGFRVRSIRKVNNNWKKH
ncbi:sodium ion-translocating decarboxylase gamma subunit [Butyrivibrio proteoclasticus B316]|uniref:Sodium ion-translocating decarboxylase gamma subunit n=2 Tax=Butyrivibrio proteoclasticus TaxID=43305 RepID=E0S2J9_BUTPB|nr:sodium ion-translocating decarboxylase gamma subunit [Butyrivibrio proteoclasticus B316]